MSFKGERFASLPAKQLGGSMSPFSDGPVIKCAARSSPNHHTFNHQSQTTLPLLHWLDLCQIPVEERRHTKLIPFRIGVSKGQLILKCPFGVFKSPKRPTKFYFDSLTLLFWFDLFLEARAEILKKNSLFFWEIWRQQKDILKLAGL